MGEKSKARKRDERLLQYFQDGGWDANLRAAACLEATVCKMELVRQLCAGLGEADGGSEEGMALMGAARVLAEAMRELCEAEGVARDAARAARREEAG